MLRKLISEQTRRKPSGGFLGWLWNQHARNDSVGDLAYDFCYDSNWMQNPKRYEDGCRYLKYDAGASEGALSAYRRAWHEYSGRYWGGELRQWLAQSPIDAGHISGYVYFIVADKFARCKIGRTTNVEKRFSSIQSASPVLLRLHHSIGTDDAVYLEQICHRIYWSHRYRGEWFDMEDDVLEGLKSIETVSAKRIKQWESTRGDVEYLPCDWFI